MMTKHPIDETLNPCKDPLPCDLGLGLKSPSSLRVRVQGFLLPLPCLALSCYLPSQYYSLVALFFLLFWSCILETSYVVCNVAARFFFFFLFCFGAARAPNTKLFMSCGNVAASATLPLSTKGGQFIRPHLLDLAPYTPIEPFEVSSYSSQNFVVVCLLF